MTKSYIICATPRTGSTLLCSMLKSSGVAGTPESYFRAQDKRIWSQKWGLAEGFAFTDFLSATIKAGTSDNGVFAARIMWGTMTELVDNLSTSRSGNDKVILEHAFGQTAFIYLIRRDFVAQAVSRLRAEQTDLWHITDNTGNNEIAAEPHYDFNKIHQFMREAEEHNAAWRQWFKDNKIKPHIVYYEELSKDPVNVTRATLNHLGIELPQDITLTSDNKRIADDLNEEWITRFKAENI